MKRKAIILSTLFFLSISLTTCSDYPKISELGNKVFNKLGGNGNFAFTTFHDELGKEGIEYIDIRIDNCDWLSKNILYKEQVTSLYAYETFKILDESLINRFDGINIYFEKNRFGRDFYYKMDDLKEMNKTIMLTDSFIDCVVFKKPYDRFIFCDKLFDYFNTSTPLDSIERYILKKVDKSYTSHLDFFEKVYIKDSIFNDSVLMLGNVHMFNTPNDPYFFYGVRVLNNLSDTSNKIIDVLIE